MSVYEWSTLTPMLIYLSEGIIIVKRNLGHWHTTPRIKNQKWKLTQQKKKKKDNNGDNISFEISFISI